MNFYLKFMHLKKSVLRSKAWGQVCHCGLITLLLYFHFTFQDIIDLQSRFMEKQPMKKLSITLLDFPKLISAASKLTTSGYLANTFDGFTYLDVNDDYIHQLFPLLESTLIKKPDYFGDN